MSAMYEVFLTKSAQKQLDKLADDVADDLLAVIAALGSEPRPHGSKKLKGRGGYRVRKGDYRIIYDIFDKQLIVEVIALGHRREIYE